ncbi:MAG: ribulose-phosphate 3-epimerase [Spirochaetaceae bacterium]|nr:ribulose-phosphate 3-epimerase [Spirochaetaceae bacterium]MBP3450651.1 ribulose-phosphate 3-epimerase [Spirochaetaceae bacterium]MBQ3025240.1 ribulose-phosphate 3-epimerase [Spirochaetaceae bacterium]MBQ7904162.1 ribulose-phosphate 3-epimerase [Spirochaetaceae bacterium]
MLDFPVLAPSLLSADFANLAQDIKKIEDSGASFVHIDVMDGIFVPQISFGQPVVSSIRKCTKLPFDVHLMIEHPENQIDTFIASGADYITFHYEASVHHHRIIQKIKESGIKAGISIVPSTSVETIKEILPYVDLVLVMTVNPGYGGQKLIPECLKKINQLKKIRQENDFGYIISVDGGVNNKTLSSVIESGAEVIVSGSSFFSGDLDWNGKICINGSDK